MSEFYAEEADYWINDQDLDNDIQWSKYSPNQRRSEEILLESAIEMKKDLKDRVSSLQKQVDLLVLLEKIIKNNNSVSG